MAGSSSKEPAFLPVCSPTASMDASPLRRSLYPHDCGQAFLDYWPSPRNNAACLRPPSAGKHALPAALSCVPPNALAGGLLRGCPVRHGTSRPAALFTVPAYWRMCTRRWAVCGTMGSTRISCSAGHSQGGFLALAAASCASWPDGQTSLPCPISAPACFAISGRLSTICQGRAPHPCPANRIPAGHHEPPCLLGTTLSQPARAAALLSSPPARWPAARAGPGCPGGNGASPIPCAFCIPSSVCTPRQRQPFPCICSAPRTRLWPSCPPAAIPALCRPGTSHAARYLA